MKLALTTEAVPPMTLTFNEQELGVTSIEEFNSLSEEEQLNRANNAKQVRLTNEPIIPETASFVAS